MKRDIYGVDSSGAWITCLRNCACQSSVAAAAFFFFIILLLVDIK